MIANNRKINQDLLKQSIKQNDMDLFLYILTKDPSLAHEKYNHNLNNPIHTACEYGRKDMVIKLV